VIAKVLAFAAGVCGVIAIVATKGAFGVDAVQFAGAGVVLLAAAVLL
jgi:hypothetical protein